MSDGIALPENIGFRPGLELSVGVCFGVANSRSIEGFYRSTPKPSSSALFVNGLFYLRLDYFSLNSLWLSRFTATSSIGCGLDQTLAALRQRRAGLVPCAFETVDLATFIGEVTGVDTVQLSAHLAGFDCRNNRLNTPLGSASSNFPKQAME
jgi:hypothetical protein